MSKFNNNLNQIFNIEPIIEESFNDIQDYVSSSPDTELSILLDHDLKDDYEKTRDSIDSLISKGTEAIDDMLAIARETEKARDFEVAGNMIKTIVDASKDLLDIHKKMRELTGKKESCTTNIKNAVFVGSTSELLKAMKEIKNGSDID